MRDLGQGDLERFIGGQLMVLAGEHHKQQGEIKAAIIEDGDLVVTFLWTITGYKPREQVVYSPPAERFPLGRFTISRRRKDSILLHDMVGQGFMKFMHADNHDAVYPEDLAAFGLVAWSEVGAHGERRIEVRLAENHGFVAWFQSNERMSDGTRVSGSNIQFVRRPELSDGQVLAVKHWLRRQMLSVDLSI